MKKNWITKFIGIIFFSMLLNNSSFADCYSDLNSELKNAERSTAYNTYDKGYQRNLTYVFSFSNPTKNTIEVTKIAIKAKDGNTVYSADHNLIIDPYTKYQQIGVKLRNNFTKEVVENGYYSCRYVKAGTKSKKEFKPKSKKSDNWFKWWYLLFIIPALAVINGIVGEFKSKSNKQKKTQEKILRSSKKEHPGNLIEDLWEGKKPLGETFWLYFILINFIISFGSGFFSELYDNNLFVIPGAISNIFTMVAVWNSSTNYQLLKIKQKKPYGWAYAAKVIVVLNGLAFISQVVLLFE